MVYLALAGCSLVFSFIISQFSLDGLIFRMYGYPNEKLVSIIRTSTGTAEIKERLDAIFQSSHRRIESSRSQRNPLARNWNGRKYETSGAAGLTGSDGPGARPSHHGHGNRPGPHYDPTFARPSCIGFKSVTPNCRSSFRGAMLFMRNVSHRAPPNAPSHK